MSRRKAGWRWVRVPIDRSDWGVRHTEVARGYTCPAIRGLAVTAGVGPVSGKWVITHRASGLKMPGWSGTRRDACRVAEVLASISDWKCSASEMAADTEFLIAARTILEVAGAR